MRNKIYANHRQVNRVTVALTFQTLLTCVACQGGLFIRWKTVWFINFAFFASILTLKINKKPGLHFWAKSVQKSIQCDLDEMNKTECRSKLAYG